jgi:hypothetical protein
MKKQQGNLTQLRTNSWPRSLSTTQSRRQTTTGEPNDLTGALPTPISHFSETEVMMGESVRKFAQDQILPKVRAMDEAEKMDSDIIEQCFEQGLMGIEIPDEFGGAGMNFTAAIVGIEELARVDPSVSVMVDVHNTLVNTTVLKYGTNESKRKWLPKLATTTVGKLFCPFSLLFVPSSFLVRFTFLLRLLLLLQSAPSISTRSFSFNPLLLFQPAPSLSTRSFSFNPLLLQPAPSLSIHSFPFQIPLLPLSFLSAPS